MSILPYSREDHLGRILELEQEVFPSDAWDEQDFDRFEGKVIVSPYKPEEVLGYIFYSVRTNHIANLVVDPLARKMGLATALLENVLPLAKIWWLEVDIYGPLNLYHKFGFRVEDLLPNFYGEGRDAYKMWQDT